MAKKRANKIYDEEEENLNKRSINGVFKEKEEDQVMGVNAALEQEKTSSEKNSSEKTSSEKIIEDDEVIKAQQEELLEQQYKEAASRGLAIPRATAARDPKKNEDPLEGEDLGLEEDDFLLARKVTEKDLIAHNLINEEALLGSNIRKPRDFISIFSRGPSNDETPKIDSSYPILNNQILQKQVAAIQLLHNYHSKDNKEKRNTLQIFKELYLEEDIIKEIREDRNAYKDEDLIQVIMNRL